MSYRFVNLRQLFVSLAATQAAGVIGSLFAVTTATSWYATLNKSPFNPPDWVFGPVWILLYVLIGIALYLVWHRHTGGPTRVLWIRLFSIQLVLNALWSYLFFGLENPLLALIDIAVLLFFILALIAIGFRINKTVAYVLIPYYAWVSFAAYLNYSIWVLN